MIAIVVSQFNELITSKLLQGAERILGKSGRKYEVFYTYGAFEIPQMINKLIRSGKKYEGFIAIGCIIKGETKHNEYISKTVIDALMKLSLDNNVPITLGILTVESMEQALNRAGGKFGNKGEEAAEALLELLD